MKVEVYYVSDPFLKIVESFLTNKQTLVLGECELRSTYYFKAILSKLTSAFPEGLISSSRYREIKSESNIATIRVARYNEEYLYGRNIDLILMPTTIPIFENYSLIGNISAKQIEIGLFNEHILVR